MQKDTHQLQKVASSGEGGNRIGLGRSPEEFSLSLYCLLIYLDLNIEYKPKATQGRWHKKKTERMHKGAEREGIIFIMYVL